MPIIRSIVTTRAATAIAAGRAATAVGAAAGLAATAVGAAAGFATTAAALAAATAGLAAAAGGGRGPGVGDVEARTFEDEAGRMVDLLKLAAALLVFLERLVGKRLHYFESIAALFAGVFVGWHFGPRGKLSME